MSSASLFQHLADNTIRMLDAARLFLTRIANRQELKIPFIAEEQLGIDTIVVQTVENKLVDGNISKTELRILSRIVAKQKPNTIFEIGTFDGRTTVNMARCAPDNAKVYTLDLPKQDIAKTKFPLYSSGYSDLKYINKEESGARWRGKEESKKIIQLFGDSATFDYSQFFRQMDFVFVDGSHARDYVCNDTEVAFQLVGDHGTIVWHDYGVWEDVSEVLNDYFDRDWRFRNARHIRGTCFVIVSF